VTDVRGPCRIPGFALHRGPRMGGYGTIVRSIARERRMTVTLEACDALAPGSGIYSIAPAHKERSLLELVGQLLPVTWTMISHPLAEAPDSYALVHAEPNPVTREGVEHHRNAGLHRLLSPRARRLIPRRGIHLMSYHDLAQAIPPSY
jgi:hypothetical protein